jgi:hypothetical protein
MFYTKLKDFFEYKDYAQTELINSYGTNGKGLFYFSIDDTNAHLFDCIRAPFRKHFYITVLKINIPFVPPHTDSNIKASINFYIQTNNCKTTFYDIKNPNFQERKIKNQTNGSIFNIEDLNETSSFIAKDNEAYLLDVTKPHSVLSLSGTTSERIAICLQTLTLSYEETLTVLS